MTNVDIILIAKYLVSLMLLSEAADCCCYLKSLFEKIIISPIIPKNVHTNTQYITKKETVESGLSTYGTGFENLT